MAAWGTRMAVLLVLLFTARLGVSGAKLTGDSIETARGAHTTLARRHPQWREPCLYIRAHGEDAVVVTTTYLPTLYYAGRVDNWYPAAYIGGESLESGMDGLKSLADFQRYVAEHPKGFFVAEWWRFSRNAVIKDLTDDLAAEVAWVEENLAKVEEASTQDVTLYAWGFNE